jgi:hypothetical protein
MGVLEQEITVTGTVRTVEGERAVVESAAEQGGKKIIKNGEAELRLD